MIIPGDFGAFLTWVGSDAVIGAVLVWLWNWPVLANLKTWVRVIILAVVGVGLAVGSYLGITYIPAGVVDQIQPYWRAVVTVVIILTGIFGANEIKAWLKYRKELQQINIDTKRQILKRYATAPYTELPVLGLHG